MKKFFKKIPWLRQFARKLNNLHERTEWVSEKLCALPRGSLILDAGCGSQQFRKFCSHLDYRGQDFGKYHRDEKATIGSIRNGDYEYGHLDYTGNIWEIEEKAEVFDAILCTEVLEHIPYPGETITEFGRLIKPGGSLILTAPFACRRHMDPYFFYSGFSDRWYEKFLTEGGFDIVEIKPVGDYYSWMGVELARTGLRHGILSTLVFIPAALFFFTRRQTSASVDTLCMGYHVLARKRV